MKPFLKLHSSELKLFAKLNTPQKIQNFLNTLAPSTRDSSFSPRRALTNCRANCIEGATLAAVILWFHGRKPLLLDLTSTANDLDHVVALFRQNNCWGAISKSNHAVLRYREPVYSSIRELAMSYFHEYFLENGRKTMRSFSRPFDLSQIKDHSWITATKAIWSIGDQLDRSPHTKILTPRMIKDLRLADPIEIKIGKLKVFSAD
jgi:hypothetical protein